MTTQKSFVTSAALFCLFAASLSAQVPGPTGPSGQPAIAVTPFAAATPPIGSMDSLVGQPVTHFNFLTLVVGYLAVTLVGLFGFVILWRIFTGKIDITLLISEPGGSASLSRFQFLIFTFVISLSLLLVIFGAKNGPRFPDTIPAGIYALLGISAASYVVSKGIQNDSDKPRDNYRVPPNDENAG
ncbi:MAG: hypothetical protein M3Y86_01610 [Verrucomicrobiota bacterium]|nr:hypothetical protein [Verrucomicrobiota bacterium]